VDATQADATQLARISNAAIKQRVKELGISRDHLAKQIGYSKSSVDKLFLGLASDAVKREACVALGLIPAQGDDPGGDAAIGSVAVTANGRPGASPESEAATDFDGADDDPPVVRAGSIIGGATDSGVPLTQADVVLPGSLVLMAMDQGLTFDQVVILARVYDVLVDSGRRFYGTDWDKLRAGLNQWL
jgi:hypothetical protein